MPDLNMGVPLEQTADKPLAFQHVLDMSVTQSTIDEATQSVEAVISSGQYVRKYDWAKGEQIDEQYVAQGMVLKHDITSLVDTHDTSTIQKTLGSWLNIRAEGEAVLGRMYFAKTKDAQNAWVLVRDKHIGCVSLGGWRIKWIELNANQSAEINGKVYTAREVPLRVVTQWELGEGSLCVNGLDWGAVIKSAQTSSGDGGIGTVAAAAKANNRQMEDTHMDPEDKVNQDAAPPEPTTQAAVTPAPAAPPPTPKIDPAVEQARREATEAERQRVETLQARGEEFGIDEKVIKQAVKKGLTPQQADSLYLEATRQARTAPVGAQHVQVGDDRSGAMFEAIRQAVTWDATNTAPSDPAAMRQAEPFRFMGFHDIGKEILQAHGIRAPRLPSQQWDSLVQHAASTGVFSDILTGSALMTLKNYYQGVRTTAHQWCVTRTVKDFLTHDEIMVSMVSQASIATLGNGREFKHATGQDKKESMKTGTRGFEFGIKREEYINDSLGVFLQIPQRMGIAFRRDENALVYALMALNSGLGPAMNEDSECLFSASHAQANYVAHATNGPFGKTGLSYMRRLLRLIADLGDGENAGAVMGQEAEIGLFPTNLEEGVRDWLGSQNIMIAKAGTTDATTTVGTTNQFYGYVQPLFEPLLDSFTDGDTAWFLLANQTMQPTVAFVRLEGSTGPVIQKREQPSVYGMNWIAYNDIGVAGIGWRGAVKSKGEA